MLCFKTFLPHFLLMYLFFGYMWVYIAMCSKEYKRFTTYV